MDFKQISDIASQEVLDNDSATPMWYRIARIEYTDTNSDQTLILQVGSAYHSIKSGMLVAHIRTGSPITNPPAVTTRTI
jgi:hypothetical protein